MCEAVRGAVRDAAHDVANHAACDAVRDVAHDATTPLVHSLCPFLLSISLVQISAQFGCAEGWLS